MDYLASLIPTGVTAQPTPVYEDNTACIKWWNNVISGRERAKHIDIRKHFAHKVMHNGHMKLIRVSTTSQLEDILTKPLHFPQYLACVAGIFSGSEGNNCLIYSGSTQRRCGILTTTRTRPSSRARPTLRMLWQLCYCCMLLRPEQV